MAERAGGRGRGAAQSWQAKPRGWAEKPRAERAASHTAGNIKPRRDGEARERNLLPPHDNVIAARVAKGF